MNFFVSDMDAYKRWVRRNKEYVHSLESLANVSPSQFLVISLFFFLFWYFVSCYKFMDKVLIFNWVLDCLLCLALWVFVIIAFDIHVSLICEKFREKM